MPDTLGDEIRRLRQEAGMTQAGLANAIGTTQRFVSGLETGQKRGMENDTLYRLSAALGVDCTHWGRWFGCPDQPPPSGGVPLLGLVAAGRPIDPPIEPAEERYDVRRRLEQADRFALKVVGDSMIGAHICDGDVVYIRKASRADNGKIVVARVNGGHTMKRLRVITARVWELLPCNPEVDSIVLIAGRDEAEVVGVLVGLAREYE